MRRDSIGQQMPWRCWLFGHRFAPCRTLSAAGVRCLRCAEIEVVSPDKSLNADPDSDVYSPPVPAGYAVRPESTESFRALAAEVENLTECLASMTTKAWSESHRAETAEAARDRLIVMLSRCRPYLIHERLACLSNRGKGCSCGLSDLLPELDDFGPTATAPAGMTDDAWRRLQESMEPYLGPPSMPPDGQTAADRDRIWGEGQWIHCDTCNGYHDIGYHRPHRTAKPGRHG